MLVAIEDIIDKSVDNGGLANCLISEEDYLVFEDRRDCVFADVKVADVSHCIFKKNYGKWYSIES